MQKSTEMLLSKRFDDKELSREYVDCRPGYDSTVLEKILEYMKRSCEKEVNSNKTYPLAIDVGCGPGLMSTVFLAPYFYKVLGVDISESQINQATLSNEYKNIEYRVSPAESLPVENNSVTLVQVAAALHWFDPRKFYRECDRVLVPGGVIAIFSYTIEEFIFVNHSRAAEVSKVLKEINSKLESKENPHYAAQQDLVKRKYTDPVLQIPYTDRTRIDNKYVTVRTTISGLFRFYRTLSHVKPFISSCPENLEWWNVCCQRLMDSFGTDDAETPLTYKLEAFLLLGRKPNKS